MQGKPGEIRNIPVSKPKEDEILVKITHVSLVRIARSAPSITSFHVTAVPHSLQGKLKYRTPPTGNTST